MSAENSALLQENPKGENESWEAWGERLSQKYPTPAATPNLPLVPGYDKLRKFFPASLSYSRTSITIQTAETWAEYGTNWKDYYNTQIAGEPIPTSGPTLPPLPTTDATGEGWAAWGKAVSDAWNAYAAERGVDLPKVLEGLKSPTLIGGDWIAYTRQWEVYGNQVGERFRAVLAAKSA